MCQPSVILLKRTCKGKKQMKLSEFKTKIEEFITYLDVEKNLSRHTCKSYASDLGSSISFGTIAHKIKKLNYPSSEYLSAFWYAAPQKNK